MEQIIDWLFGTAAFVPHGACLLWRLDLVMLHAASDLAIAGAYLAMPAMILGYVRSRNPVMPEHRRLAGLFCFFLFAGSLAYVVGLVTLWWPFYGLQGLVKAATAAVCVMLAVTVWRLGPRLSALPTQGQLHSANAQLQAEIAAHQLTLAELEASRADLERLVAERTEDLRIVNTRFEKAIANSTIVVTEQDAELKYTWIFNAPEPLPPELLGRRLGDVIAPEFSEEVDEFKLETLKGAAPRRHIFEFKTAERSYWFDMKAEPMLLRNGKPGLITTSTDISDLKRQEEQLRVVMRELNHRSKNLLAIVQAIARQTARSVGAPEAFSEQLGARLTSLAKAHDVLARHDWTGADLGAVVDGQIGHLLHSSGGRVRISGEDCSLRPESAHYLALALHELGANAAKYGALSGPEGQVDLTWRTQGEGADRRLHIVWTETGGPPVTATERRGFGRLILEQLAPGALNGAALLEMAPEGVCWRLDAPLPA